jgi:hypothetical protein
MKKTTLMLLLVMAFEGFSAKPNGISYQAYQVLSPNAQEIPDTNAQGNIYWPTVRYRYNSIIVNASGTEWQRKLRTTKDRQIWYDQSFDRNWNASGAALPILAISLERYYKRN